MTTPNARSSRPADRETRAWRCWLVGLALLAPPAVAALPSKATLEPTLETHTGPWYRPGAPIVRALWQPGDPGQPLLLRGRVLSTAGAPVADALVELWHTNSAGEYPPLRASLRTRVDGGFGIRTVLPGHNAGYRARHIHFVVTHPRHQRLVTRIYFKGDPNMAEAIYPELAIFLEEGLIEGETVLFGDVEFVVRPL